jgi:Apea-like HEPN
MTPLASDHQSMGPEVAAALRIDTARAVIVGNMSLNAAFERICEFSVTYRDSGKLSISRTSQIMENPLSYPIPDIHDSPTYKLIGSILEGIDALDKPTQDRVRLSLRWYQRALGERRAIRIGAADVDSLINYWIAFETLVRVGERKVAGTLIRELSEIHGLSSQEAGQTFPIGKIYARRKEIVHGGQLKGGARFKLQQFLSDVFVDILVLRTLSLPERPRTEKYLDGGAYDYL